MKKKTYIRPEAEVILLDTIEMLAVSINVDQDNAADSSDGLSLEHRRGEWGNLWANE